MNQEELYQFMSRVSGYSDFTLELKQINSRKWWGRYFPWRRLIRLYALDDNGTQYADDVLIREGLHELAHHIQWHHVPGFTQEKGTMHDRQFHEIHKALLDKAFGRSVPVKYSPIVEKIIASRK